jgi:hypothetical protein
VSTKALKCEVAGVELRLVTKNQTIEYILDFFTGEDSLLTYQFLKTCLNLEYIMNEYLEPRTMQRLQ